jgi:hypothetical protein
MPRTSSPAAVLAIILISYFMILLDNSVLIVPSRRGTGWRGALPVPGSTGTANVHEGR